MLASGQCDGLNTMQLCISTLASFKYISIQQTQANLKLTGTQQRA